MTDEYIRRQDAVDAVIPAMVDGADAEIVEGLIYMIEPAEVVEAVRCRNCYLSDPEHNYHCTMWGCTRPQDGFCDMGKSRDE